MRKYLVLGFILYLTVAVGKAQDCKKIEREVDKFTGNLIWRAPKQQCVGLSKRHYKQDGTVLYNLLVTIPDAVVGYGKGIIILFEDGEKMTFPDAQVETRLFANNLTHIGSVNPSAEQMQKITRTQIDAIKLYIFDVTLKNSERGRLKNFAGCLLLSEN